METKKKEKVFDAVKMMREIRDKISAETQNMTFEELKKYIEARIKKSGLQPIGRWERSFICCGLFLFIKSKK